MAPGTMAPFSGRFGAAMPSGMGGAGAVSFSERSSASMAGGRTPFTLRPMSGSMVTGSSRRPFGPPNLGASGFGGGLSRPMPSTTGMGVMPPNFGSPFRPPTNLGAPGVVGSGMSM